MIRLNIPACTNPTGENLSNQGRSSAKIGAKLTINVMNCSGKKKTIMFPTPEVMDNFAVFP